MGFRKRFSVAYNYNHNCHSVGNLYYNSNESISTKNIGHLSTTTKTATATTTTWTCQQIKTLMKADVPKKKFQPH